MTTEPTNRQMAAVARKAADLIQDKGKATGRAVDDLGRLCALGAIALALHAEGYETVPSSRLIAERCVELRSLQPIGLVAWSDLPTTTEQDIAKVFLQVADDLEVAP